MNEDTILKAIATSEKVTNLKMSTIEKLVKTNYTNLSKGIAEIKESQAALFESDKQQAIDIALLEQAQKYKADEFMTYKETEKTYGIEVNKKIEKIKGIPIKVMGIFISFLGVIVAGAALILKLK